MRHPKLKIHQTSWGKGKLQVNLSTTAMSFTVKTSFANLQSYETLQLHHPLKCKNGNSCIRRQLLDFCKWATSRHIHDVTMGILLSMTGLSLCTIYYPMIEIVDYIYLWCLNASKQLGVLRKLSFTLNRSNSYPPILGTVPRKQ